MAETKTPKKIPSNGIVPEKKPKILIVDDHRTNIELLMAQLKAYPYELVSAADGEEALRVVEQTPPDLILLDLMMPKVSGYQVCQTLKNSKKTQFIPIIVITALKELEDKIKAIEMGADDFLMKPFNKVELITRVKSLLKLKELYDDVDSSESIIFTLAEMLEAKDVYTRGHSERVARYAVLLAKYIGLSEAEQLLIRKGALLHDIGKIGICESILNKPDKLSQEELAHIRSHPARGCEICKTLKSLMATLPVIRHHHERIDGKGYPDGIGEKEINLAPRIVAIADAYDAMTSNRPYRKGIAPAEALKVFERERLYGQWDPELVSQFIKLIRHEMHA
ncbi:MAG: response regulator [Deltaproteobacteria bacterium]|nr:response regulator [Deltaproteobacteria bacterium]